MTPAGRKPQRNRHGDIPLWSGAAIDPRRERQLADDEHTFLSVFRIMLRSWPYIRPQLFAPLPAAPQAGESRWRRGWRALCALLGWLASALSGGRLRVRNAYQPGHLAWYLFLDWVNRSIAILTGAYTIDVLTQVLLQGEPMTESLAWLLALDLPTYVGAGSLTQDARMHVLALYTVALAILWFVHLPFRTFLPYYNGWILQHINQDLRGALVARWNRLSMRYHNDAQVGDSIYRIYQDSAMVTAIITRFIATAQQIISAVTCVFFVFFFDPVLAVFCLACVLPMLGWGRWFSPRMRIAARVSRETGAALASTIQETFTGIRVVKAFRAEARELARFERESANAFNAQFRTRTLVVVVTMVTFAITALLLLGSEYLMARWANLQVPTWAQQALGWLGLSYVVWNLGAFTWVKAQLADFSLDLRGVTEVWCYSQDIAMGLERVFDILDMEPDVRDAAGAAAFTPPRRDVRFEDVHFGYRADRPILRGVSFAARTGTINAIVGPTGAGKSTLMVLLLRLFDPDRGRILVDGRDLRSLTVDSLRAGISIALQENLLFALSVADNIRYVRPEATDEEVREAARIACADEFIEALPEGYATVLGDRGGTLSTGQKQRLSIARAVLKDTPILILDEPTAALDGPTEKKVLENLAAWGRGRVVFLITHRISTIRFCDQILYLNDGVVLEAGDHGRLMREPDGRYRRFIEAENGSGAAPAEAEANP